MRIERTRLATFHRALIHFAFLAIVLALSSCGGKVSEIQLGEVHDVKILGFEENSLLLEVSMPIHNPSMHKIKVSEVDLKTYLNGTYIGRMQVDDQIVIKRKKNSNVTLPIKIRLSNVLASAFIMMNMKSGEAVHVKFEGSVLAKSMIFKRRIEVNETRQVVI